MSRRDYFKTLDSELCENRYKERYLRELEDHAEDFFTSKRTPKKKRNKEALERLFGKANEVRAQFVDIIDPWQRWVERIEAFIYGVLSLAWVSFMPKVGIWIDKNDPISSKVLSPIFFLVLPFIFIWPFLLQKERKQISKKEIFLWTSLPLIIASIVSGFKILLNSNSNSGAYSKMELWTALIALALGLLTALFFHKKRKGALALVISLDVIGLSLIIKQIYSIASSFRLEPLKLLSYHFELSTILMAMVVINMLGIFNWLSHKKYIHKVADLLKYCVFIYISAYSILRILNPYLDFRLGIEEAITWKVLFLPLYFIDSTFLFFIPSRFFTNPLNFHYLQIGMVFGFLIIGSRQLLKKKRAMLAGLCLLTYSLGFILIPPHQSEKTLNITQTDIRAPYIEVSERIQRSHFGFFYGMVEHLEFHHRNGSGYEIEPYKNGIVLRQFGEANQTGAINGYPGNIKERIYYFNFINDSISQLTMKNEQEVNISFSKGESAQWPSDLKCLNNAGEDVRMSYGCKRLTYKDRTLIKQEGTLMISIFDFEWFEKEKKLALVLNTQQGDQKVYLLNLAKN